MNAGYQQYKEQSINTMTPNELMLMLFDELVKRLTRAELALQAQNFDLFDTSVERSIDIIRYLDDTLDRQYPISTDLHRMYDFFIYSLNRIRYGRNLEELQRVKPMIVELRDTFRIAEKTSAAPSHLKRRALRSKPPSPVQAVPVKDAI